MPNSTQFTSGAGDLLFQGVGAMTEGALKGLGGEAAKFAWRNRAAKEEAEHAGALEARPYK